MLRPQQFPALIELCVVDDSFGKFNIFKKVCKWKFAKLKIVSQMPVLWYENV